MNVYQRLNAARKEFHGLKLTKTGENKFAGYKYFELGDFLIPAMEVLEKHGLCAVVSFDKEIASMRIVCTEPGTLPDGSVALDCITITSPMGSAALKGCHEVQNIGAVETYQRRYLWVAALEIVEHDALDATTGKGESGRRHVDPNGGKPLDGAGDSLTQERRDAIDEIALDMILLHKAGKDMDAVDIYYDPNTYRDDGDNDATEERKYLWKCLAKESKLRAVIKNNNPHKEAA